MAATENMQREEDIAYYHWGRDGFSENTEISDSWEVRVHEDCRVFFVECVYYVTAPIFMDINQSVYSS